MEHSPDIAAWAAAFAKAQGAFLPVAKSGCNTYSTPHRYYSTLTDYHNAVKDALKDNGLSFQQFPNFADGAITIETVIWHETGQWVKHLFAMPTREKATKQMNDTQADGSSISYAKKYALGPAMGIAPSDEDDDGESAGSSQPRAAKPRAAAAAAGPSPNTGTVQCPHCHCPPGKPHTAGCKGIGEGEETEEPAPVAPTPVAPPQKPDAPGPATIARQAFEKKAQHTYGINTDGKGYAVLAAKLLGGKPERWNVEAWENASSSDPDGWRKSMAELGMGPVAAAVAEEPWPDEE